MVCRMMGSDNDNIFELLRTDRTLASNSLLPGTQLSNSILEIIDTRLSS